MRVLSLHSRRSIWSASLACAVALVAVAGLTGATAAAPARTTTSAKTPSCTTSGLVVWLDTFMGSVAGGTYYDLELTNLSGHTCTLEGYPRVSAVNLAGLQLGSAASSIAVLTPSVVTLSSGTTLSPISSADTATVLLKITDVGVYGPTSCVYADAAGLRVYPPGQTASKVVPYPFEGCSRVGPAFLHVEAVEKFIRQPLG